MTLFKLFLFFSLIITQAVGANYLELWLMWVPAHCMRTRCKTSLLPFQFTIHGLWPTQSSGTPLPPGNSFIFRDVPDLENFLTATYMNTLAQVWPNWNKGRNDSSFWLYQWQKHGSASRFQPGEYFDVAQQLYHLNDIGNILTTAGIYPGTSYKRQDYQTALDNGLMPGAFIVQCFSIRNDYYIYQIAACYDELGNSLQTCAVGKQGFQMSCGWNNNNLWLAQ